MEVEPIDEQYNEDDDETEILDTKPDVSYECDVQIFEDNHVS